MRRFRRKSSTALTSPILAFVFIGVALAAVLGGLNLPVSTIDLLTILPVILVLLVAFGLGLLFLIYKKQQERIRALKLSDIDRMSGVEFERYVGELLKYQKYAVTFTKTSGDFGADIVAKKDGQVSVVQLKRYNHAVGIEAVQQAIASQKYYTASFSMVITNSFFTKAAKELARVNECILVDRTELTDWIVEFQKSRDQTLFLYH